MKDTDLAWAAGFLDGEGCFHIAERKSRQYVYVQGVIKANQVEPEPIQKLHNMFGGQYSERNIKTVTGKTVYEWTCNSFENQIAVVPLLLPYFLVKQHQAKLVLELAHIKSIRTSRASTTNQEQYEILNKFNKLRRIKEYVNAIPA